MARRRRDNLSNLTISPERDAFDIANDAIERSEFERSLFPDIVSSVRSPLREVEDRRLWHPDRVSPARSLRRWYVRVTPWRAPSRVLRKAKGRLQAKAYHAFQDQFGFRMPQHVAICVRRKMRKEVLHALRRVGAGGGRRRRRNYYSSVRC